MSDILVTTTGAMCQTEQGEEYANYILCRMIRPPTPQKCPGYYIRLHPGDVASVLEPWECGVPLHCHYFQVHFELEW